MLFGGEDREKQSWVDAVADEIKERLGTGVLRRGSEIDLDGQTRPAGTPLPTSRLPSGAAIK